MNSRIVKLASRDTIDRSLEVSQYVLQQMTAEQRFEFESRLVRDKSLQQALTEELNLRNLINDATPEQIISDVAFEKFSAELDSDRASRFLPRFVSITASLLVFAIAIFFYPGQESGEFETLSNDESQLIENFDKSLYTVIFRTGTTVRQLKMLEQTYGFSLVSEPGAANSYLVKFEDKLDQNILVQLRENPEILFIEPAVSTTAKTYQ